MGDEEFAIFGLLVGLGSGEPIRFSKRAHLRCLNAHLHATQIIQVWKPHPDAIRAEVDRLLGRNGPDQ